MHTKSLLPWILLALIMFGFAIFPNHVYAVDETITVDTTLDSNDPAYQVCSSAPDDCSLRGAISKANNDAGTDYTINVPGGIYTLSLAGFDEDDNATGDLDILVSLDLQGDGMHQTILQAGASAAEGIDRVLHITPNPGPITVHISDLTIRHGKIPDNHAGAGVRTHDLEGDVYIDRVAVRDNLGGVSYGGGISVFGHLQAVDSIFTGNHTDGEGGGIYQISGLIELERVSIYGNSAGWGGGFMNNDIATLVNVTISGNTSSTNGGGIGQWNEGDLSMHYSTVTDNTNTGSNTGWAIYSHEQIKVYNSIITAQQGKSACSEALDDGHHNIGSDSSCGGSVQIADPLLGSLRWNGGYTWSHALKPYSPAIDTAGEGGDAIACPSEDQNLVTRPIDGDKIGEAICDIGAYEGRPPYFMPFIVNNYH